VKRRSSWGRKRRGLRWGRVVAWVATLILGLALSVLWLRRDEPQLLAHDAPANIIRPDLRDVYVRYALGVVADPRRTYFGSRQSLFNRCSERLPEAYAVEYAQVTNDRKSQQVLIERNPSDRNATAWSAWLYGPPGQVRERAVSADDVDLIEAASLQLWRDGIAPIDYELTSDHSTLLVEFCHRGSYGAFAYENPDDRQPADKRVIDLANQILEVAGAVPIR